MPQSEVDKSVNTLPLKAKKRDKRKQEIEMRVLANSEHHDSQTSAAQLFSESLHSTRLLSLRKQTAARCAASSTRMAALFDK